MNEDTDIRTIPLPYGRDWQWFAEANVLCLAPHLSPEGRERAIIRAAVTVAARVQPDADGPNVTQPLAILSPRTG